MNYEIKDEHRELTKEEIRYRKSKVAIPQAAESFERDILDDIIEWENNAIICQEAEREHSEKCSEFTKCIKSDDEISQCC